MKKITFIFSLMMIICASHAQIYQWTDSQGTVHFSDSPHVGSTTVKIPDSQTFSGATSSESAKNAAEAKASGKNQRYQKLVITQPDDHATIRNNQGYIVVAVQLEPNLLTGDNLQLVFDGSPLGDPQANPLFQLNGIYRGSHTIAVQALDANGNPTMTSQTITVYMQRPRVGMGKNG